MLGTHILLSLVVLSGRDTAGSFLWSTILVCSVCFVAAAILGLLFKSRRWWSAAIALVVADLLMGIVVAILDHAGYGR